MDKKKIIEIKEDGTKSFYLPGRAYYAESIGHKDEEIMISYSAKGGGSHGEFRIRWIDLSGNLIPQLQIFDDAWLVLYLMPELIEALAEVDSKDLSIQQIIDILLKIGFKDQTLYKQPSEEIDDIQKRDLQDKKESLLKQIKDIDRMLEG